MTPTKLKDYKQQFSELNKILNDWDFLYASADGKVDEYNDLINPILGLLKNEGTQQQLAEYLSNEITKEYGIKMKSADGDVVEATIKIMEWWRK